jgi:type II secretory pathway pseudopilin PulG
MRLTLHSRTQSGARASPPATAIRYSLFTIHYQNAFTVLELVMVVGVLSVLLAAVVPTIKTVRTAALRRQAAAEATALVQAAIRYKTEYGFWPGQVVRKDDVSVRLNPAISDPGAMLSLIVSGPKAFTDELWVDMGASPNLLFINDNAVYQALRTVGPASGSRYGVNPLNPKGISFLRLERETDPIEVGFPDPWKQPYVLFMGLNPRTVFTYEIKDSAGTVIATHSVSNQIAFAFSRGPAGPNNTNYIYSAGVRP